MRLQTSTVAFQVTKSVVALRILPKWKCFDTTWQFNGLWASLLLATKLLYT